MTALNGLDEAVGLSCGEDVGAAEHGTSAAFVERSADEATAQEGFVVILKVAKQVVQHAMDAALGGGES